MRDPYRDAEHWTDCPNCGAALGWNTEDRLADQACSCGYVFTGHERRVAKINKPCGDGVPAADDPTMVRTPRGWLGRYTLDGALRDDMPVRFGYVYGSVEQAAAAAGDVGDAELVPFRDVDL